MTEEQLLVRASRDSVAFEEFYRRTVARVVTFAARRCRRAEEVPDLVAAIWLEVIASADRFDPRRGSAVPWLLGVAANVVASDARRKAREREAAQRLAGRRVLDDDDVARLERAIDAAALAPEVREAIEALPPGEPRRLGVGGRGADDAGGSRSGSRCATGCGSDATGPSAAEAPRGAR